MKNRTCNICPKRANCKELCSSMRKILKNYKKENDIYSDNTFNSTNRPVENIDLSNIFYSFGLSNVEDRDIKRIIIAFLNPKQKKLLSLYSQGYTQKEIAKMLNVSQSNISQRIDAIKTELKSSLVELLPYIVEK